MTMTPTFQQRLRYSLGGVLPDTMRDWVRHDLVGPGSNRRYLLRVLLPTLPFLSLFLLFPGPNWIAFLMMAILFVPLVYFAVALDYVWRRFRLLEHGLDPALVLRTRRGAEHERETYEKDYGHP